MTEAGSQLEGKNRDSHEFLFPARFERGKVLQAKLPPAHERRHQGKGDAIITKKNDAKNKITTSITERRR